MIPEVAIVGRISLDLLFAGASRLPGEGEEIYSEKFDIQLGCSSFVYAAALHRLGVPIRFGTFLSAAMRSQMARILLEREFGSDYINLYLDTDNTVHDPIMISAAMSTPRDRSFMSYADEECNTTMSADDVYQFYRGAKVVPTLTAYPEVMCKLAAEGVRLVHDTWWHDDMSLEREIPLLQFAEVFSPNDKEALKLTKTDNVEDAIKILARHVRHPIITMGSAGSMTFLNEKVVYVKSPVQFNCVDTTGAGDNFLAGVMYGMYQGWDIIRAMQAGNICGGHSTTQIGCCKAYLDEAKLLSYLQLY